MQRAVNKTCRSCLGALLLLVSSLCAAQDLPKRVMSLSLCTDTLALDIAMPGQLQSVSWLAAHPQQSLVADRVTAMHFNHGRLEEVLSFQPDLVLASAYSNPYLLQQLRRLEVPLYTLADAQTLTQLQEQYCELSLRLTGVCRRPELPPLDAAGEREGALIMQVGGWTATAPSLMDEFVQRLGLHNLANEAGIEGWGQLDLEQILRLRPQWLLLVNGDNAREGYSQKELLLQHPVLQNAPFQVLSLPAGYFGCGSFALLDLVAQTRQRIRALREATVIKEAAK